MRMCACANVCKKIVCVCAWCVCVCVFVCVCVHVEAVICEKLCGIVCFSGVKLRAKTSVSKFFFICESASARISVSACTVTCARIFSVCACACV